MCFLGGDICISKDIRDMFMLGISFKKEIPSINMSLLMYIYIKRDMFMLVCLCMYDRGGTLLISPLFFFNHIINKYLIYEVYKVFVNDMIKEEEWRDK